MAMVDDLYEALMRAGHRPNDVDAYEITHVGLLVDRSDRPNMAEESYRSRMAGRQLVPMNPVLHPVKGAEVARALETFRAKSKAV